jgi:hypothetical protein
LELSLTKDKAKENSQCLDNIKYAFLLKKPSIISIHRINFAGEIFPENRNKEDKKIISIMNAEKILGINIYNCSLVLPYRRSLF